MKKILTILICASFLVSCYSTKKISNSIFLIYGKKNDDFVLEKSGNKYLFYTKNYYIDSSLIKEKNSIVINKHDELIFNKFKSVTNGFYIRTENSYRKRDSIPFFSSNGIKIFKIKTDKPICNWTFDDMIYIDKIECLLLYDNYCFQNGYEYNIYTFCNEYSDVPKYPKWFLKLVVIFSKKEN